MEDNKNLQLNTSGDAIVIYKSRKAALSQNTVKRGEGVYRRTVRLVKGLKEARVKVKALDYCSTENKAAIYGEVFRDAYEPVFTAGTKAANTLWNFIYKFWYDLLGVFVFIINLIIKFFYYLGAGLRFLWDKLWDLRVWADANKRTIFQIFAAVVVTVSLGLILVTSLSAYEYSYFGRKLGTARTKRDVYQTIDVLGDKLAENAGANISFNAERDIVFKRIYGFGIKTDSQDDILNTLTYMSDIHVTGYAIVINGQQVAIMDKPETAEAIIAAVKENFAPRQEGYDYTSVSFEEEVTIQEVDVNLSELWNPDEAERYIETGEIRALRDDEEPHPLLTVYAAATVTYDEEIAYGVQYKRDSSMYQDEVLLEKEGVPGINRIVALVQTINGKEVSRFEQNNEVISQPQDAVYRQGTKEIPTRNGSGTWIFPIKARYMISDYFGYRVAPMAGASTNHKGIDIACAFGTSIYAADGGTVTFAGRRGAYGLLIIINHGGGYETYYGHESEIDVKVGEEVYQGKVIGKVGSTGVSTGPHCHFEIHYQGTPVNPLAFYGRD